MINYNAEDRTFDCPPSLNDEQVVDFCRDGYLLLRGVVRLEGEVVALPENGFADAQGPPQLPALAAGERLIARLRAEEGVRLPSEARHSARAAAARLDNVRFACGDAARLLPPSTSKKRSRKPLKRHLQLWLPRASLDVCRSARAMPNTGRRDRSTPPLACRATARAQTSC
mgnify:CR=1 FL=1